MFSRESITPLGRMSNSNGEVRQWQFVDCNAKLP